MYDYKEILAGTNGGLDIIIYLFPEAKDGADCKKKFCIRKEKTPSAKLILKSGIYFMTDFGSDSKGKNAITLIEEERNLTFPEACKWAGEKWGIATTEGKTKAQNREKRPAIEGEHDGLMTFSRRAEFTIDELKVMFAESLLIWQETINNHAEKKNKDPYKQCQEVLKTYGWSALDSYSHTIKGVTYTTHADKDYPLFLMEDGELCKLYKPKEREKKYRFQYYPLGALPKDHVWGMKQALKAYRDFIKTHEEKEEEKAESGETETKKKKSGLPKLEQVIICSGERDSMNVALMGYKPVWLNSETKGITSALIKQLDVIAHKVMNLPDIDATGLQMGIKAALDHINIYTILLPLEMLKEADPFRGTPCKDLRDFLALGKKKKDFDGLVNTAYSSRFYDKIVSKDKNGNPYSEWDINSVNLRFFLWCNGFRKFKNERVKDGFQYVRITGHIVKEVKPSEIRGFVLSFLTSVYAEHRLVNRFTKSTVLNDTALEHLVEVSIDFKGYGPLNQMFFFKNEIWNVTKDGIEQIRVKDASRSGIVVWDSEVVQHSVEPQAPYFEITADPETGIPEAHVKNIDNTVFQYLIATCRTHWKKEETELRRLGKSTDQIIQYWKDNKHALDGPQVEQLLSPAEVKEHRQHLANKLFVLGYILHRYKDQTKPWAIFATDGRLSEEGTSFGRSGKSLLFKAVRNLTKTKTIGARDPKIVEKPHLFEGVDRNTGMILVDDCAEYLKYDFFFTALTDSMTVNPKHVGEIEVAYEDSPKFVFTSNYALKNPDPSLLARLVFCVFSDFFHEKTEESDYESSRSPKDYLGKELFKGEFTKEDWNSFINLCAQAVHFYLKCTVKINPPMAEINLRTYKSAMGDAFHEFAEVYFAPGSKHLNNLIVRQNILNDFLTSSGQKAGLWSTRRLTSAIKAFVNFKRGQGHSFELNPKELRNSAGRIIRKDDFGNPAEFIYIRTSEHLNDSKIKMELPFENQLSDSTEILL